MKNNEFVNDNKNNNEKKGLW